MVPVATRREGLVRGRHEIANPGFVIVRGDAGRIGHRRNRQVGRGRHKRELVRGQKSIDFRPPDRVAAAPAEQVVAVFTESRRGEDRRLVAGPVKAATMSLTSRGPK